MMDTDQKSKILIVDDSPSNIFFLEGFLKAEGYDVSTAKDGFECLDYLKTNKPDMILLDIMMPEMDGLEVLEKIVNNEETCNIPVVMVTARTDSEDLEKALSIGAIEYIKKPIDEIELLARVKSALKIKQQEDKLKEMLLAKEEFIRIISHDVRTPFAAITGLAKLLYSDPELTSKLNADQKESLKFIIDSSHFIVNYFNKMLSWSSLGSKELVLNKEKIKLSEIISNVLTIYKTDIEKKEIEFNADFNEDLELFVDITYFTQVMNNLINNAIKYTPRNGNIKVFTESRNNSLKIVISDSGTGLYNITPEELFKNTINKSAKGTEGEKGTGIGLHICKKILNSHGFEITFKINEIGGTDFIIIIN